MFKSNKTLNSFTYQTTELLSLGVYIDINCLAINESRTEVIIEVRRKIGGFDKSHEVSLANTHISNLTGLITQSIDTEEQERILKFNKISEEIKQKQDELNRKNEEGRLKAEEQKQNNPVLYYFRQFLLWLLIIGMMGGVFYMIIMLIKLSNAK